MRKFLSHKGRSSWKGIFIKNLYGVSPLRRDVISKFMCNKKVFIHNGLLKRTLYITKKLIGYKYGQFIFTKKMGSTNHFDESVFMKIKKKHK